MSTDNRVFAVSFKQPEDNYRSDLDGAKNQGLSCTRNCQEKKQRNVKQLNSIKSKSDPIKAPRFERTPKLAKTIKSKKSSLKPKHLAKQLSKIKRKKFDQTNNPLADRLRADERANLENFNEPTQKGNSASKNGELFSGSYDRIVELTPGDRTNSKSKDLFDPLNQVMQDSIVMKSSPTVKINTKTAKSNLKLPSILERSSSSTISERETGRAQFRCSKTNEQGQEKSNCRAQRRSMDDSLVIDLDKIDSGLANQFDNQFDSRPGHLMMSYFNSMKHLLENGLNEMENNVFGGNRCTGSRTPMSSRGNVRLNSKRCGLSASSSNLKDKKVVLIKPISESCARLGHLNNKAIMSFRGALRITKNFYPENNWAWIVCFCTVYFHLLNFIVSMNGLSLLIGHLLFEQRYIVLTSLTTSHLKCIDLNNYFVLDKLKFHSNQIDRKVDFNHTAHLAAEHADFFNKSNYLERIDQTGQTQGHAHQASPTFDESKQLIKRLFDYGLVYLPSSRKQTQKFLAYTDFKHFADLNRTYLASSDALEKNENFPFNRVNFSNKENQISLENLIKFDQFDFGQHKFDSNKSDTLAGPNLDTLDSAVASGPEQNDSNAQSSYFKRLNAIKIRLNQLERILFQRPVEENEKSVQKFLKEKKYLEQQLLENLRDRSGDSCAAIWFGNLVKSIESGQTMSNSQIMFQGMGMLHFDSINEFLELGYITLNLSLISYLCHDSMNLYRLDQSLIIKPNLLI